MFSGKSNLDSATMKKIFDSDELNEVFDQCISAAEAVYTAMLPGHHDTRPAEQAMKTTFRALMRRRIDFHGIIRIIPNEILRQQITDQDIQGGPTGVWSEGGLKAPFKTFEQVQEIAYNHWLDQQCDIRIEEIRDRT